MEVVVVTITAISTMDTTTILLLSLLLRLLLFLILSFLNLLIVKMKYRLTSHFVRLNLLHHVPAHAVVVVGILHLFLLATSFGAIMSFSVEIHNFFFTNYFKYSIL